MITLVLTSYFVFNSTRGDLEQQIISRWTMYTTVAKRNALLILISYTERQLLSPRYEGAFPRYISTRP